MTPRQRLARLIEVAATIGITILLARLGIPPGMIPPLFPPPNVSPTITVHPPAAPPAGASPADPYPAPVPQRPDVAPAIPTVKVDPVGATVKLVRRGSYCSATVIGPRDPSGRQLVLTAAHCTSRVGEKQTIVTRDGRKAVVTTVARSPGPDFAWLITDPSESDYPYTLLSDRPPTVGQVVYHSGYGVVEPGTGERGTADGPQGGNGRWHFLLSCSHGDSGSGIIDAASGRVVGVVSTGAGTDPSPWTNGPTTEVIRPPSKGGVVTPPPGDCPDGNCPVR